MLKKFRKSLQDTIGFALTGIDRRNFPEPESQTDIDIESHPIHGLFTPIFQRYAAIERRAPGKVRSKIDEVLHKAGCLTPTNASLLNLNLAVYAVLLILQAGKGGRDEPIYQDILAAVERDWAYSLKKANLLSLKAPLTEQLGNLSDRQAFLLSNDKPDRTTSASELHYPRAEIFGFLLSLRNDPFGELVASGGDRNGQFVWNWAYGHALDKYRARLDNELRDLVATVVADTGELYGSNAADVQPPQAPPEDVVLPCPNCGTQLRLPLPPKAVKGKCVVCRKPFQVVMDSNPISLAAIPTPPPVAPDNKRQLAALTVLGIQGPVGPAAIRAAYRKRLSEYHPDKVSNMGPKIRALAEEETKDINSAMAFLRGAGYLDD